MLCDVTRSVHGATPTSNLRCGFVFWFPSDLAPSRAASTRGTDLQSGRAISSTLDLKDRAVMRSVRRNDQTFYPGGP